MDIKNIGITIVEFFSDTNSKIVCVFVIYAIFGITVRRTEGEEKKKWSGSLAGIAFIYLSGGLFHLWHVMLTGIVGCVLVAYTDKSSCHKVAFIFMFSSMTLYGILEIIFLEEIYHIHVWLRTVQMTMIFKIVGVAFEINDTYKIKESLKNGEKNISEDVVVDPKLSDLLHYTFSIGVFGPCVSYRTYNDYLTLPFSRVVGTSLLLKQCIKATIASCIYETINYYWPLYGMLFWIATVNEWTQTVFTAVGIGAYPIQCINKCGLGPSQNYSVIKKTTYAEAEKMQYDFEALDTIDILTMETTPWMSEQVRGWNKGVQYFMWKCVRQQLPSTGFLKNYRVLITCFVSSLSHGVQTGCFIGLLCIPACIWAEEPYKIIIYQYLSGWRKTASLLCMYLFRVYMSAFAGLSLMLRDFESIYQFSISIYFMPIIVFIFVQLLGRILLIFVYKNKKRM